MRTRSDRRRRVTLIALASLLLVFVTASPALACCFTSDADDAPGKLDMDQASGFKDTASSPLVLSFHTFAPWKDKVFSHGGGGKLTVWFDTDGDLVGDYRGKLKLAHHRLVFIITGNSYASEPLRVHRPNTHAMRVTVPGNSTPNPASGVSFYFVTSYVHTGTCFGGCVDEVPDTVWFGPI